MDDFKCPICHKPFRSEGCLHGHADIEEWKRKQAFEKAILSHVPTMTIAHKADVKPEEWLGHRLRIGEDLAIVVSKVIRQRKENGLVWYTEVEVSFEYCALG